MGQVKGSFLSSNGVGLWLLVFKQVKQRANMDPQKVQEIVSLKLKNIYPPNVTKSERSRVQHAAFWFHLLCFAQLFPLGGDIVQALAHSFESYESEMSTNNPLAR